MLPVVTIQIELTAPNQKVCWNALDGWENEVQVATGGATGEASLN